MNQQQLAAIWDHLRLVNGIGLRCVAAIPTAALDSHPIPNMRTPKELAVHIYGGCLKGLTEGAATGEVKLMDEAATCASIKNRDELVAYCRSAWEAADRAAKSLTDQKLAGPVKTPWGDPSPGAHMIQAVADEFLHHRGQLYAYLRALGVEPPMNWDFEHSDPAYQPKAKSATA